MVSVPTGHQTFRIENKGPGTIYYEVTNADNVTPASGTSPSLAANASTFVDVYLGTLYAVATVNTTLAYT